MDISAFSQPPSFHVPRISLHSKFPSARSRDFGLMRLQRRHRDRRMDIYTHIYPYLNP